ncbi:Diaminopimelate decarboxylase [Buchnera aphidicola (Pterocallis alni)]|uniref:diaminopimelate decarboxylase n=1 Tax=Buchnera aphidicola TaxID=9 RepID=UPI0034649D17
MLHISKKNISLNPKNILSIIKKYNTPIWLYDAEIIQKKINQLNKFDIIRFAQKACSNIHILKFIRSLQVKVDAVSLGEIERALLAGFTPHNDEIIFTADMFDKETLNRIIELNITVNAGSLDMLKQLGKISPGHRVWIRINPKFGDGHNKKTNTGGENSKHGLWNPELALPIIKKYKLNLIGLHMHIGSGVNYIHLQKVCHSMIQYSILLNQNIQYISAGGGLSIPYKSTDSIVNTNHYFKLWNHTRNIISNYLGYKITLEIEPGRFLVGESGILITQVYSIKYVYKKIFILVDAGFNDLIRPAMYGSYHHISVLPYNGRNIKKSKKIKAIIGGPLCESGDIFTQDNTGEIQERILPEVKIGDYIIFHHTGAYGSSMSSNYNTKLLIPEILFKNNIPQIIRRKQTFQELFQQEMDIKNNSIFENQDI